MQTEGTIEEVKEISKEQKELNRKKANNIKLYPIYKMLSWDLLFYYAIIYLFLTIEKGCTPAQVLQFDAFYMLFKFILQIPATLLIQKIGKRESLLIANLVLIIHILIIMFAANFEMLLFSQILSAFSYIIKGTCETDMLYDSLEHGEKRGIIFSKIDGKATSKYYYMDAISAILSGFLFIVNPYIPMILCLSVLIIALFLSIKFEEIHQEKGKMQIKEEFSNIKYGFKKVLQSKRLKSLVIFNAIFIGLIGILKNIRNTILLEIGVPEQYFGIIIAIFGMVLGITAKNQGRIHKKYRNKTLSILSLPFAISFLIIGTILLCHFNMPITITLILFFFVIQHAVRGPYYVLIKQYLNNFTNSEKRIKIATVNNLIENVIASGLVFGASYMIDFLPIGYTTIIIGCISTVCFVLLLDYMRGTVGLRPEQYGKKEIL